MTNSRKTYSGAFKAEVVLELLRGKKTLHELAHQNGLHPNQIKNWKCRLFKEAHHVLEDKRKNNAS